MPTSKRAWREIGVKESGYWPDNRAAALRTVREVILCAFDLLELDGDDMRLLPLEQRQALAELVAPIIGGTSAARLAAIPAGESPANRDAMGRRRGYCIHRR